MSTTALRQTADPVANAVASRVPVRVCFVIDRLNLAGTETQLLKLIRGLDRSRVVPHLCLLDGEDPLSRSLEPADCPVLRLGVRALARWSTVQRGMEFSRFLRRERIDVVQLHFPDSTLFAAPFARLAGVRHVLRTRRDLGYWFQGRQRWLSHVYRPLITGTLANCQAAKQAVIAQERAAPATVHVLENGIDLERYAAIPPCAPDPPAGVRRVGMVANLRPIKGPDIFLRAAGLLADRFPEAQFAIAGGGDEPAAREVIAACNLAGRCELRGSVRDVPGFLGALDVAVLASRSEGLSNAVLEYMAAGRPIVVTDVGANRELIVHEVHGLVVPPEDPPALAAAIGRLLADRPLACRLAAAARQRVAERYAMPVTLRRHEEYYLSLVGGSQETAAQGAPAGGA